MSKTLTLTAEQNGSLSKSKSKRKIFYKVVVNKFLSFLVPSIARAALVKNQKIFLFLLFPLLLVLFVNQLLDV